MMLPLTNIFQIFSNAACSSINQIAIEINEQSWTYGELLINVIRIAHHIPIETGDIVFQYVEHNLEMISGLLAIMCAGGIYFPLSPTHSYTQVRALINEIQGACVLVNGHTHDTFSNKISERIQMINIEYILLTGSNEVNTEKDIYIDSNSPSLIINTASTVGQNKFIVHTHKSLIAGICNLINWDAKNGDIILYEISPSYNIASYENLVPLLMTPSSTLVLSLPEDDFNISHFCKNIIEKQITIVFMNLSFFEVFIEYLEQNRTVCYAAFEYVRALLILEGSPRAQHLAKIKCLSSYIRIFLIFGSIETNAAIGREVKESIEELLDLNKLPIGCPLATYHCLLVDESQDGRVIAPLDSSVIGQIYLAGTGLFQCYYNDPNGTNRSRVIIDNEEYFKIGELAQYNVKGELVHVRLIDFQIKNNDQQKDIVEVVFLKPNFAVADKTNLKGKERYWKSLPSNLHRSKNKSQCSIVDINGSTILNDHNNVNIINKNNFYGSLQTTANISNDDQFISDVDGFDNVRRPLNTLSNLEDSYNLDERIMDKLPFPDFPERSLYCFHQTTPLRYQCLTFITWIWFERLSMFVILLNCITLAMYQPCAEHNNMESSKKCDTPLCIWLQGTDYFVSAFFTIEMCIKMIAMGVFGRGAYFAESWNWLDCFIVISGLAELLIPGDNLSLSAIRTIRVLRPLRAINRVPSLRILVMLLFDTLPMLGNVLLLCFFTFFIFGVVGVQLWKGLLRNRCFLQINTTIIDNYTSFDDFSFQSFYIPPDQDPFICSEPSSNGMTKCSEIPRYRHNNMICKVDLYSLNSHLTSARINGCINWNQYYQLCANSDENPFSGSISFDNIGFAWLAIFQIITLENWVRIMYYIQDAHSFWDWIYFVCLTVIGSFFMMNLCLAVISAQFSVTKKREIERMLTEQKRFSPSSTVLISGQQDSCWKELIRYCEGISERTYKKIRIYSKNARKRQVKNNRRDDQELTSKGNKTLTTNAASYTPLINTKHRQNCKYNQFKSSTILISLSKAPTHATDTCEVISDVINPPSLNNNLFMDKKVQTNEELNFDRQEQQIEVNHMCDCQVRNIMLNTSDNNEAEEREYEEKCRCSHKYVICCCCFVFKHTEKLVSRFSANKYFDRIIFAAILINTFTMAIEHHGQPQSITNIVEYSNYIFIMLFTIEMFIKIIAEGCFKYLRNPLNIFDGGIVIVSLIELYGNNNSGLSVLRTFRLLRIIKIIRFMPTLRRQFFIMVKTLDNVAAFLSLLMLFVFIFSVLGMHLFGGEFCTLEAFNQTSRERFNEKCRCCACVEWNLLKNATDLKDLTCIHERANFDSLRSALLTVFQILTQEDWNEVLYNGMEKKGPWSALYFIMLMIFGNYVLLNLLIAILVESFSTEKEDGNVTIEASNYMMDRLNEADPFDRQAMTTANINLPEKVDDNDDGNNNSDLFSSLSPKNYLIQRKVCSSEQKPNTTTNDYSNSIDKCQLTINNSLDTLNDNLTPNIYQPIKGPETNHGDEAYNTSNSLNLAIDVPLQDSNQYDMILDVSTMHNTQMELKAHKIGVIRSWLRQFHGERVLNCLEKRENYSFYLFSPSNRVRIIFQRLITHKWFDYIILIFISFNCITLAMERPTISPTSFERKFLNYTNYVFTAIFMIEMFIKVLANGFVFGLHTYLHTGWNFMDGFLVMISVVDVIMINYGRTTSSIESDATLHILSMLKVLRLLRTLRPLTIISRAPGLQLVVQTLLSSLRPIIHIVIICCIFFIIFGILGVQLFKGKFYYCEGPQAHNMITREQCETMSDHRWRNQQYNFNNLGQALLTLFVISSKDGWVEIMYNGIDAVDVGMQPITNHSEAKLIYFVSFILIVGFFILNMFVGVVVENFHNCRAKQEREEEIQNSAKEAQRIERQQRLMHELPYYAHFSPWRKRLHDSCKSKYFDLIIACIIGFNAIAMSLEHHPMPSELEKFLEYCNYIFTIVFLIEFVWKIFALGPSRYFKNKWNQLDSLILLVSIAGLTIEKVFHEQILPINPTLIRAIRILRIARVLKLLKMSKGVQVLLDTVIKTLPQVGNLCLLFFLLFFIFATLGIELFGKLECNEEQPCSGLNKHAHFKNFGLALLTLFCIATGDNWSAIMKDTLRDDDPLHLNKNQFMSIISPIYFVIFVLMTQFILVNILVAVLMKRFEDSNVAITENSESDQDTTQ